MRSVNTISAMALMDTTRAIAAATTYSLDAPNRGQHRRDRHPKKWHRRSSTSISWRNLGPAESNEPRIPQTATDEAGAIFTAAKLARPQIFFETNQDCWFVNWRV